MTDDILRPRDDDEDDLPAHETRETESEAIGGGVMSAGGTAHDRGTGELTGRAQNAGPEDVDEDEDVVAGFDSPLAGAYGKGDAGPGVPRVVGDGEDERRDE